MIHLLIVFLLQLIVICSGEFCSNECGSGDVQWCGERKVVGQDLLACAEWSKYDKDKLYCFIGLFL